MHFNINELITLNTTGIAILILGFLILFVNFRKNNTQELVAFRKKMNRHRKTGTKIIFDYGNTSALHYFSRNTRSNNNGHKYVVVSPNANKF